MIRSGNNIKEGRLKEIGVESVKASTPNDKPQRKVIAINYQEPFTFLYQWCNNCKKEMSHRKYPTRIICSCRTLTEID